MRVSLIVAAGGTGSRFLKTLHKHDGAKSGRQENKLFAPLEGVPVLLRSLRVFSDLPEVEEIICALPGALKGIVEAWKRREGLKKLRCVSGGRSRAESVYLASKRLKAHNDWVMIHDGARPLIAPEILKMFLKKSQSLKGSGFILGRAVVPTLKKLRPGSDQILETVDRRELVEAETPQLFRKKKLCDSYALLPHAERFLHTDEAALLEKCGETVSVIKHEGWNPKMTTVHDLKLAEAYVQMTEGLSWRIGMGSDTHRLAAKRKFCLGGIRLPAAFGPVGHSDGDALLHALTDAIAGALGWGDIGDFFSDQNPQFKNIRSAKMLSQVLAQAAHAGWKPAQADTIIHLDCPKMGPLKIKIQKKIAALLSLPDSSVGVKAKTFEGLMPAGSERVECQAVVVMRRMS